MRFFQKTIFCLLTASVAAAAVAQQPEPVAAPRADLILRHAVILTGEGLAEGKSRIASAIAIGGGKVMAVGTDAEVARFRDAHTKVRDLNGAFVMPGLNDAHVHLGGAGQTKLNVDLTGTPSLQAMLAGVQKYADASPAGHWLVGGNWDHTLWAEKVLPTRRQLDAVTGGHPAALDRIDGHILIANSAALQAAGVTGKTVPPQGGAIDLDANGEPTGILRESAMELVYKVVPPPSDA